jgi:hypothetical protein
MSNKSVHEQLQDKQLQVIHVWSWSNIHVEQLILLQNLLCEESNKVNVMDILGRSHWVRILLLSANHINDHVILMHMRNYQCF